MLHESVIVCVYTRGAPAIDELLVRIGNAPLHLDKIELALKQDQL
jgi:hypothetical protein